MLKIKSWENVHVESWEKEEKQELIKYVEFNQETKTFPIPDGWEILDVNTDNFDKYAEKLSRPTHIPQKLSETTLNYGLFSYWYKEEMESLTIFSDSHDIVIEYMLNSLELGTGKFIQKIKKDWKNGSWNKYDANKTKS